jgi:plasmid stability protein
MTRSNLTLTIDEDLLRRARIRAVTEGTSVNAIVREHLERYAGASPAARAIEGLLSLSDASDAGSGPSGRTWTREELYERGPSRDR